MPDQLHIFRSPRGVVAASFPLDPDAVIAEWSGLRRAMVREVPTAFTRDEWAYLLSFLDPGYLARPFRDAFGDRISTADQAPTILFRPRGPIALWLPNNVSLLGPLTMILLSMTGQPVWIKGGSSSENLTAEFLGFAVERLPAESVLRGYLADQIRCEVFDRSDPRNAEMAAWARIRIVFGSDAAARSIDDLPHLIESLGFSFVDRRSEAWVQEAALTDEVLIDLLRVFAIYGQAGCTSPKRVVLLDGDGDSAFGLRDRLVDLWPQIFQRDPPMHMASGNMMACQWAAALGWDARITVRNGAVIACGDFELNLCDAPMLLAVVPASVERALASLPANIQTIGYALQDPNMDLWLRRLAGTTVKRFVPLDRMHHFGPVWDGWDFWQQLFEPMEIQL
jgi:hypothetical protein